MPAEPPTCDVYVCSDCGLEADSKKQLHTHRNRRRGPVFAKFLCPKCKNGWSSAHAYCKNFQQCKGCKTRAYPQQAKYKEKPEEETEPLKPHQADLCERCIKGLHCSAASRLPRSSPERGRSRSSPRQVRTTPSGGKARPQPYAKKQQAPTQHNDCRDEHQQKKKWKRKGGSNLDVRRYL